MDIVERLRGDFSDERLEIAADTIERLREALRTICDGARDVEKSYAELFAQVKIEARAALKEDE